MKRNAFTLLEILLVVFILTILMAVTIPRFSRTYRHMVLRQTGESVLALLQYAREEAILNGKKEFIKVDQDKGRIFISNEKGEPDSDNYNSRKEIQTGKNTGLSSDVELICFNPSGDGTDFELKISTEETTIFCRTTEPNGKMELIEKE